MSAPLRLGLLGLGTVGQGVVAVLARNGAQIASRIGRPLVVTAAAVRRPDAPREVPLDGIRIGSDPMAVVEADDVDVVVELIGGLDPAERLVRSALERGRPVVTANKALIAERGAALFALARETGTALCFEAAVAGGIPVIKALREGLAANRIHEVEGIINGTCNYILTRMRADGAEFAEVLPEAQRLGYAEADPAADVDGLDAAHKLAILAALAFDTPPALSAVQVEGIRGVRRIDLALAGELGYRVKHIGLARRGDDGVELRVHPVLLPEGHMLAKIDGVTNSVLIRADAVGSVGFYGPGAGAEATASAVLADVIDIACGTARPLPASLCSGAAALPVLPADALRSAWYLRLRVADEPGVLRAITAILADHEISIEAILQKEPRAGEDATVAMITSVTPQGQFDDALAAIRALPFVREDCSRIRVEH